MKKLIALLLMAALTISCFSGCGGAGTILAGEENPETFLKRNVEDADLSVVVILGYHANAVKPNEEFLWDDTLKPILEKAVTYSYDEGKQEYSARINISVIISDGDPEQVELMQPDRKNKKNEESKPIKLRRSATSTTRLDKLVSDSLNDIRDVILSDTLKADDAEVDLVASMNKATKILTENPGRENHIVVIDTGVTTDGYLDMRLVNIQRDTAAEVVKDLQASAVVDLKGIHATFKGVGNICGSQVDFREDDLVNDRLVEFWEEYFKRCDATVEGGIVLSEAMGQPLLHNEDADKPENKGKIDTYPTVSSVPFSIAPVIVNNGSGEAETQMGTIVLNSTSLTFKGDSDEFRDEKAAEATLLSYEQTFSILKDNPSITIYVVGSKAKTAPDENVKDHPLSKSRAEAVKKLICSVYQIDESQIKIVDAGTQEFTWRDAVEYPDGRTLDSNAQQQNRVVAIVPSVAPEAQELMDAGEI